MTQAILIQNICNGLMLGSLYALLAIGYTMVYGILRLINFAHCDIFMLAMYLSFYCISVFGLPWYFAFIIVILATAAFGILTERAAYAPLRKQHAPPISLLTSAIGMSYLLENLATVVFSGRPKSYPDLPFLTASISIGGVHLSRLMLIVPILTLILLIVLHFMINKTKMGMAMRGVAKDAETAQLMGISIDATIMFTFGIGSALAAVGAILFGLKYPQITPLVGVTPGLKCFIAAVVGGIGNIWGAVIGGLGLGLCEVMLVALLPSVSGYKDAFAFVILIIVLLFRPNGILGEKIADKV